MTCIFSLWSHKATDLPISLQPIEKPLRQTCYYKSALESQYQLLEDKKRKAHRKHWEKYTAISTNCKNSLMKFFRNSTDKHLILNFLPSYAVHGIFIRIRHYVNILYTICMDRSYTFLNWSRQLSYLMCSGKRDHNCGDL